MAMISEEDQQYLREHFAKALQNDVKISYFTQHQSPLTIPAQACMYCKETGELLAEIAGLSDRIKLETYDFLKDGEKAQAFGVDKLPATVIEGGDGRRLYFYGIPSGYEFSTLIEDIVMAAEGESGLAEATKTELAKITADTHIQVFVTPT